MNQFHKRLKNQKPQAAEVKRTLKTKQHKLIHQKEKEDKNDVEPNNGVRSIPENVSPENLQGTETEQPTSKPSGVHGQESGGNTDRPDGQPTDVVPSEGNVIGDVKTDPTENRMLR